MFSKLRTNCNAPNAIPLEHIDIFGRPPGKSRDLKVKKVFHRYESNLTNLTFKSLELHLTKQLVDECDGILWANCIGVKE